MELCLCEGGLPRSHTDITRDSASDLETFTTRFDSATMRILKVSKMRDARCAMRRLQPSPQLLTLFDSIRGSIRSFDKVGQGDVIKRYEGMLTTLKDTTEVIMKTRVKDMPSEVSQLMRVWREYCCHRYAWSLVSSQEIHWIMAQLVRRLKCTTFGIIDPFAGTGWHGYLVKKAIPELGSQLHYEMYDCRPAPMRWSHSILKKDALDAVRSSPKSEVLWLSWPPHEPDPLAFKVLKTFTGHFVVFIGEWPAATTTTISRGAKLFFDTVNSEWNEVGRERLCSDWPGYHQEIVILEKYTLKTVER